MKFLSNLDSLVKLTTNMSHRLATIESDVADIKRILFNVDTEAEDYRYQSPPDNDQQPPDFTEAPPSGRYTSISHPSLPYGPLPSNPPPPSSRLQHSQTITLNLQTHCQANDAKNRENLSNAHTDTNTDVNVEDIWIS